MTFPAKYPGTCKRCKQKIKVGEDIKTPTRQPFVHDRCIQVLSPEQSATICDLVDDLIDENFTCIEDGYFERDGVRVVFEQTDNELIINMYAVGFYLRVYEPGMVTALCNVLAADRPTPEDEFNAYRDKLLERYDQ